MPFPIVIGSDPQPDTGFGIVIGTTGPDGALLDFELPSVSEGATFLIAIVRDDPVACSDETWTQVPSGQGASGRFIDVFIREVDGTLGSRGGDIVSFLSTEAQELQGSLVTLRYANFADLVYEVAHASFTADDEPATPSVTSEGKDDLALCIWSADGDVDITVPAGFAAIDSYTSSEFTERTLAVATRRLRGVGSITLDSAELSTPSSGRVFTLALHYDPPPGGFSHWGPHFPDQARPTVTKPGIAAGLSLEDPVTISSALQHVVIRARSPGIASNNILFTIETGTLADGGEVQESGNEVTLLFNDGDLASDIFATINATSTLVEAVGFVSPGETLIDGEDNFDRVGGASPDGIFLEGGVDARVGRFSRYFGPHFPSTFSIAAPTIPPATADGAATLALRIESGLRVTYEWQTDIFKSYDGKEQRAALLDDPRETYAGRALLTDSDALSMRSVIARHVSNGATFMIGLPYEATTAEASGATLALGTPTASLDWAVLGQRVLVVSGAGSDVDFAEGVVQAVDADSITVDDAPSLSGVVMPLVPVLLDPQQSFARYRGGCERWQIEGRAAVFGFPSSAAPGELVKSLGLEDVTFRASTPGVDVALQFEVGPAIEITFTVDADEDGNFDLFIEVPVGTTLGELNAALNTNGLIAIVSSFDSGAVILGFEGFVLTAFVGAEATGYGEMGRGATVTQLLGRPLWDRGLENPSTITDSIHSMTDRVDLGGVPLGVVEAEVPDWGRHLRYTGTLGDDFQWLKAFLTAVKGKWKSFYLPTGRADLIPTDDALADTLFVDATQGDYAMWAARGYSVLQVVQGANTYYVQVESDGETSGVLNLGVEGDTLDAGPVDRISWCELVHLESDAAEVAFDSAGNFSVALTARVVQQ